MKILIVRYSSIGDIVLTTPIIRCLKLHFGQKCEIHYITKIAFAPLLETNPYLHKLHLISKSHTEIGAALKKEKFDVIIDLHHNLRTLRLKWFLKVKMISFPKENIRKFLLVKFKINKMPKVHIIDRYFETLKDFGIINDLAPCDLNLIDTDKVSNLIDGFVPNKNFIAIAMGTQFETKQIPLDLLQKVLQNQNLPILLLGSSSDKIRAKELIKSLPEHKIYDTCGQYALRESAYLVQKACVLLTGDTGLMHIASCYKTPVVSVWGNTIPDLGMYYYDPKFETSSKIHEVHGLSCRPCSKIGFKTCPKKHFDCMEKQNVLSIERDILEFTKTF